MTQHRMRRAAVAISAFTSAAIAIVVGASCMPYTPATTKSPANVGAHAGNVQANAMVSVDERGSKGIKGSLEDDEKVTQKYFLTLGWGDDLPDADVWEGPWGKDDVMIRLVPATTSPIVSWSNALSTDPAKYSGHLVMKIIVLEDRKVDNLGLEGLETGYLWIGQREKNNSKGLGAAIYTLKPNGKAKLVREMAIGGYCLDPTHGGRPRARARAPGDCTGPFPPGVTQSSGGTASFSTFRTRAGPSPLVPRRGLWVTCPGGCCEATSLDGGPE